MCLKAGIVSEEYIAWGDGGEDDFVTIKPHFLKLLGLTRRMNFLWKFFRFRQQRL